MHINLRKMGILPHTNCRQVGLMSVRVQANISLPSPATHAVIVSRKMCCNLTIGGREACHAGARLPQPCTVFCCRPSMLSAFVSPKMIRVCSVRTSCQRSGYLLMGLLQPDLGCPIIARSVEQAAEFVTRLWILHVSHLYHCTPH